MQDAAVDALSRVTIVANGGPLDQEYERTEYARLRDLRASGLWGPLAARLCLDITLGWRRTEIAEAMDVSRVTLNNWLRQHTRGGSTFTAYGPYALEGDFDTASTDEVNAPILNKLPSRKGEQLTGIKFVPDRFIVPAGFHGPLDALWRIAYRSRGAEVTKDDDVTAASDALDVLISILLRRGVTNLAIGEAAGVTHRAVLDRMNRARARGILMSCDLPSGCESFHGEHDVVSLWTGDPSNIVTDDDWTEDEFDLKTSRVHLAAVRATSTRPSRYWLQTLVEQSAILDDGDVPVVVTMGAHEREHTKLHIAQLECWDDSRNELKSLAHRAYIGELWTSALLGRMGDESIKGTVLEQMRGELMFVPLPLLYTESAERAGYMPPTPADARRHVPSGLWEKYFAESDLVTDCFTKTDEVLASFEPTTKHPADARTRRGAVTV